MFDAPRYSWRWQLKALANASYYAVAPDLRGFGQTEAPLAVEDYDCDFRLDRGRNPNLRWLRGLNGPKDWWSSLIFLDICLMVQRDDDVQESSIRCQCVVSLELLFRWYDSDVDTRLFLYSLPTCEHPKANRPRGN